MDESTSPRFFRAWWAGAGLGLSATAVLLLILSTLGSAFISTASTDASAHVVNTLWLLVTGAGVYLVCAASQANPLVTAIPAAALLSLSVPLTFNSGFPDWYPSWLADMVLSAYNLHLPVIVGVLGMSALWSLWKRVPQRRARTSLR